MAEASAVGSNEFPKAMQETADIMLGKQSPARTWHLPAAVNVCAIRASTDLSQTGFTRRFGFSPAAVREWEQGWR